MISTLGCRLNQADSGLISSRIRLAGGRVIDSDSGDKPDIIIVNTCCVTCSASQKSRQAFRAFAKKHPQALIIAAGCDCVADPATWHIISGEGFFIGNEEKRTLIQYLNAVSPQKERVANGINHKNTNCYTLNNSLMQQEGKPPENLIFSENISAEFPFRSKAFLKIQEGCNSKCTYCIVPKVRGTERSRDKEEIIREFRSFIQAGFKEIVITGVNICAYQHGNYTLSDLLSELSDLPGQFRIRLSSTEPHKETSKIIKIMKERTNICRFLHLPVQHCSDIILKKMGRNYKIDEFIGYVKNLAEQIPGIHIGTDIICGFPGETKEIFEQSCNVIKALPLANLHIFNFSPRKNTEAANFANQIPSQVKHERHKILDAIEAELSDRFLNSQINKKLTVIVEKTGTIAEGWSDNYIKVRFNGKNAPKNSILQVRITSKNKNCLFATIV